MTMTRTPTTGTIRKSNMLDKRTTEAIEFGFIDMVRYLNNGGLQEHIFSSVDSAYQIFVTFDDFGGSQEKSKRISPIFQKLIPIFASKHLLKHGLRLREEDGDGYDFILETLSGEIEDYNELKNTTGPDDKRIDTWTLNKNSLVKVPLHLLISYKTQGSIIREVGLYLTDTTSDAVERHVPEGKSHAYAALKLMPEAMTSDKFECLVGSLSRRGKTSWLLDRPYSVMEIVI